MPGVRVKMAALVTYAVSTAGATPSLLYGDGEAAETVGGHAQKKGVLEDYGRLIKTHEL